MEAVKLSVSALQIQSRENFGLAEALDHLVDQWQWCVYILGLLVQPLEV